MATLGQRSDFLRQTLQSIRDQGVPVDVVMVAPLTAEGITETAGEFGAQLLADPGSLPTAINLGMSAKSPWHEYVNWLNDDDLLEPGSLRATIKALDTNRVATVAYGACRYINEQAQELWISKAGPWATRVLAWGPDLIPQPGMLIRSSAWDQVGGLDTSFDLAFDLDLLLKLKKLGPLVDTGVTVSSFRWHADSLTVDDRGKNISESERAKRAALSPAMRKFAWLWEPPVRIATKLAAGEVQRRARSISSR